FLIEPSFIQSRNYAARKGTRERKQKKKVKKVEVEKVAFIPHNQRKKDRLLAARATLKYDDSWKSAPVDNVYHTKYYRSKIYPFEEAVQCHRETHHPDMYNVPNASLFARIELYMQGEKKTRFVDDFNQVVAIPHKFDHGEERAIIAFSKTAEAQKEALDAGAQLAGGVDLIKQVQNGAISLQNFHFVVAHPDILPELLALRGVMKRKFPNPKNGTLDVDLATVTERFINGIHYYAKKDEHEKDFGLVETVIGTLDMEPTHLEENFAALVKDLYAMRPKREGHFISRCLLRSPPSPEQLTVDYNLYIEDEKDKKEKKVEDEDEEEGERVAL
ncbi:mitochondrial ribosomal protein L1, partial [Asbolus verrucosus]